MSLLLLGAGLSSPGSSSSVAAIIAAVIADAYTSLGFNPDSDDVFSSYYITENSTLAGVVEDETNLRDHNRSELTCRATNLVTNKRFVAGSTVTGSNKDSLSVFTWVNPSTLSGSKSIMGEYDSSSQRGWLMFFSSTVFRIIISEDGGSFNMKSYSTTATFSTGTWYHVGFVFSSGVLTVYINGEEAAVTKAVDGTVSTIHDSTQVLEIGANSDGSAYYAGSIAHPVIYESVLTPAQIRDLYLDELDNVPTPDHAWILDGDRAWTIAGSSVLSPSNTPTRSESENNPKSQNDFNHAGWSNYENLIFPSENFASGTGWSTANGAVRNADGSFTFTGYSARVQNANGPNYTADTPYKIVMQFELQDAGKDVELVMYYGNWLGESVTIDANGIATATITPTGINATNLGFRRGSVSEITLHPLSYWIYEEANNSSYIETVSSSKQWSGIAPAQWQSSTLDAEGNPLKYKGQVARNGTLIGGPCVDLNGTNQYGTVTNSTDYSSLNWVLSGELETDAVGNDGIFGPAANKWIAFSAGGNWRSTIDGSANDFSNTYEINTPYRFELTKIGTAFTLFTKNLNTEVEETDTLTITMPSSTSNFDIGSGGQFDGTLWNLKLDCTTDSSKSFNCPISEESGDKSYDISGNGKDIAWQNSPTWGTQDSYFHGEAYGCNSVPIFVDGVELKTAGNCDYDGVKSTTIELDFITTVDSGLYYIFTNGSVSPYRIGQANQNFRIDYRNSSNSIVSFNINNVLDAGVLNQFKIVITEDVDNPTTASSIVVTDRLTGELIGSGSGLDIAISYATSNSGPQQIGNYTTATSSFNGDIYRIRQVLDGVEKMLWTSDDYLNNQTEGEGDFSESGGTLDIKKIPAKEDGSSTDANGYPIQNTSPSHRNTQATLRGYLENSDSKKPIYYGAEFEDSSAITVDYDFDTDFDGWTASYVGNAGLLPIRSTTEAYNGTHSVRFIADFSSEAIISQTFNLPSAGTLQFRYFKNGNHYGAIEVRVNGVQIVNQSIQSTSSWAAGGTGSANTWNQTDEIALSAGSNAIEILIDTDADNQSTDYVYVDNIQLSYNIIGSSSIRLADDFNWHQSWSFVAKVKPADISGTKNLFHSTSANYGIKIVDDDIVVTLNGTDHTFGDVPLTTAESDVSIEFAGGDAADITVTVDDTSQTITGPTIGTNTSIPWIGASNVPDLHYGGMLRSIAITNNSVAYYNSPLYKDSLDRSDNCNHGTDTDITYLNNPATEIATLNPTITATETLAVTDGNKKLISIGKK